MMSRLLVCIREPEQRRFAPRPSEELEAGGQGAAVRVAHRYGDRREAGAGCEQLAVVAARRVFTIAFSAGPFLSYASMRLRYCSTSERHVSEPPRNAAWI